MPIAGAQGSYIAPWKQQFEDKHGGSLELDDSNFAHMAEYDPEDPAQAAKDYEEYLAGRKPIDALLERLQIDDEGARALAKTIAFCHEEVACLRFLYLANNRITKAGKAAIAEAVAKRNRITVFYEDSRPVSPGPA
ncbi:hypothetical protein Ctob_007818 [Chrysochromulina tobinii]|uniref:Uncharacterized protein n=1 Tax=Chrysochromulina tobinii TaxID=1460289 RepID=A0A0M0JZS8_9EUKA|nr:hypothetical protein Ctob_007818 [Chrysochromulina tobinii]|eukprot:KOO32059.1 hypothetical protein Ctob_007818 [Chrysochromulina sp. CCMP291]